MSVAQLEAARGLLRRVQIGVDAEVHSRELSDMFQHIGGISNASSRRNLVSLLIRIHCDIVRGSQGKGHLHAFHRSETSLTPKDEGEAALALMLIRQCLYHSDELGLRGNESQNFSEFMKEF
jgi:hypothetical protein